MTSEWIKSPTARRVLQHWADSRPAWLWSGSGETLLWRNSSARFFHGRIKKHGVKLAPEAAPIKGQIARLIRLGSLDRSSLSRIQFLAGDRPISTTCTVTPLELEGGDIGLLIVGVDPIEPELLETPRLNGMAERFLPAGSDFLLIDDDGQIAGGSDKALELYAQEIESEGFPGLHEEGSGMAEIAGTNLLVTRFKASPGDAMLMLFESGEHRIDDVRASEGLSERDITPPAELTQGDEPLLPIGLPPAEPKAPAQDAGVLEDHWVEPFEPKSDVSGLANLFDRLADDEGLYAPLTESDEAYAGPLHDNVGYVPASDEGPAEPEFTEATEAPTEPAAPAEPDIIAAVIAFADDEDDMPTASETPKIWTVTGRGFTPLPVEVAPEAPDETAALVTPAETEDAEATDEAGPVEPSDEPAAIENVPNSETVELVSRYNFDELSRILTDRVGVEATETALTDLLPERRRQPEGALINLAAETFILNRLPIGIMVFRDQQVLFANRALTELTGYEAIDTLRQAGLAAIFPGDDAAAAGPVTHLLRRDGSRIAVRARLQSIPWQGRPALMLSAMAGDETRGHEGAVRAFAEIAADAREEGFVRSDRSGVVTEVSLHARVVFGKTEADLIGLPLSMLLESGEGPALQAFLERPARFAETARPSLLVRTRADDADMALFAEGQAGVVTGYFGFVRMRPAPSVVLADDAHQTRVEEHADELEPSMLSRLSRGIRRPLNTIIGFSELIRSSAFGTIENARYLDYARDIKTAGSEIATLVDELDDYSRLKEGRYAARPADLDLGALLESCVVRVRGQAGLARVLVRSAISERLPKIRADRASLGQAVLNLLASAIDQTPAGASVILSAQIEDDGSISVNVRDSGERTVDLGERFVVFRDGVGKDGEALAPVRSSVGLALTRSLLAVNTCSLSVDPSGRIGTRFSLVIPADLVATAP